MWMSDAGSRSAWVTILLTSWMIGASSVALMTASICCCFAAARVPELLHAVVGLRQHAVVRVETGHHVVGRRKVDVDVFRRRVATALLATISVELSEIATSRTPSTKRIGTMSKPPGHLLFHVRHRIGEGWTGRRSTVGKPSCVPSARVRERWSSRPCSTRIVPSCRPDSICRFSAPASCSGSSALSDSNTSPSRVRRPWGDHRRHLGHGGDHCDALLSSPSSARPRRSYSPSRHRLTSPCRTIGPSVPGGGQETQISRKGQEMLKLTTVRADTKVRVLRTSFFQM